MAIDLSAYIPNLTNGQMVGATSLTFSKYVPPLAGYTNEWDNSAFTSNYSGGGTYKFTATAGATYDLFSSSYFQPYITLYDPSGKPILMGGKDPYPSYNIEANLSSIIWDFKPTVGGDYYITAGWSRGAASSHKYASVSVYEDVDTIPKAPAVKPPPVATGKTITGTALDDTLYGTSLADFMQGLAGNDWFTPGGGDDYVDGGDGPRDMVFYSGKRAEYQITYIPSSGVASVRDSVSGRDGNDTLVNVERLAFSDERVSFDFAGTSGIAYRLYQAAFNRSPDKAGLGYQMKMLDTGVSVRAVAQAFVDSGEFKSTYGSLDNSGFATQLYANVLHRAPDAAGLAYHVANLNSGALRADVLVSFSESTENQVALAGVAVTGMTYTV